MKVLLNGTQYELREEMPGLIRFVQVNQYGMVLDLLETTVKRVRQEIGDEAALLVERYLGSQEHLIQLLEDYGWARIDHPEPTFLKKEILVRSYIRLHNDHWLKWTGNQDADTFGEGPESLWKFLNKH